MKASVLYCILLSLLLSATVPSFISLITHDNDTAWALDATDEENNQQESEKEVGEKELFNQRHSNHFVPVHCSTVPPSIFYRQESFEGGQEVLLPPPETV